MSIQLNYANINTPKVIFLPDNKFGGLRQIQLGQHFQFHVDMWIGTRQPNRKGNAVGWVAHDELSRVQQQVRVGSTGGGKS